VKTVIDAVVNNMTYSPKWNIS